MSQPVEFRLLGPLEVIAEGQTLPVRGSRKRIILAMLLLEHDRVVPADRLIEAVWGEEPPSTARSQLQICVSGLRRMFAELGNPSLILTRPGGYLLQAADESIDVERFRQLVREGRAAVQRRELEQAVGDLRSALNLWRGQAIADLDSRLVQTFATRMNEERFVVLEECIGLELALGRHGAVIGELSELVATYPLRQQLWAHLMLAMYRAGRQGDALAAYRRAEDVFAEELGLDPGEELRALERAILRNERSLTGWETGGGPPPLLGSDQLSVPQQLPSAIPDFVGRAETVHRLQEHLAPGGCPGRGGRQHVEVVVIGGRSGVGKSALALHVAQSLREHYPDGQLFAGLRDHEAGARPERILERFLRSLGVAPALLPDRLEDLEALYRTKLANRRVLVLLDDAITDDQVLPLVPGDPHSALLITSRRPLTGLHGAHRIDLDVFTQRTSTALLTEVVGEDRVRAEPDAAAALTRACDHLPLALRVAGAKLSARTHWRIERMVDRLQDESGRLDELTLGGVGVRASIVLSCEGLGDRAERLLMLLGILGATDFAHWVAAPLLDADVSDADDVLDELVQAHLVEAQVGLDRGVRFHLHDLIRIFARERLASQVPPVEQRQAQHRLLRAWMYLADEAHRRERGDSTVMHSAAERWALPSDIVNRLLADPLGWFSSEQANLIAAIMWAAEIGGDQLCWDLALTAADFFESLGDFQTWKRTNGIALRAVRRAHNARGEAAMLYSRAGVSDAENRYHDSQRDLRCALAWFSGANDALGRGHVLLNLADIDRLCGRNDLALTRLELTLADLRSVPDRPGEAHALNTMAKIWLERGRPNEAEGLLRQALEVCPSAARRIRGQLTYWLGETFRVRGKLAEAEAAFEQVLRVVTELNDPLGKAHALFGLGRVQAARGECEAAEEKFRAALKVFYRVGERIAPGRVLLSLVELALDRDDVDSASARMAEYDAIMADIRAADPPARTADLRERLRVAARQAVRAQVSN